MDCGIGFFSRCVMVMFIVIHDQKVSRNKELENSPSDDELEQKRNPRVFRVTFTASAINDFVQALHNPAFRGYCSAALVNPVSISTLKLAAYISGLFISATVTAVLADYAAN